MDLGAAGSGNGQAHLNRLGIWRELRQLFVGFGRAKVIEAAEEPNERVWFPITQLTILLTVIGRWLISACVRNSFPPNVVPRHFDRLAMHLSSERFGTEKLNETRWYIASEFGDYYYSPIPIV